jgi:malate synthase
MDGQVNLRDALLTTYTTASPATVTLPAHHSHIQTNVFCFADSNAPTWANNMDGQVNLRDANRRTIVFDAPNGKQYRLRPDNELATLLVRGTAAAAVGCAAAGAVAAVVLVCC